MSGTITSAWLARNKARIRREAELLLAQAQLADIALLIHDGRGQLSDLVRRLKLAAARYHAARGALER